MQSKAATVEQYIEELPEERKDAIIRLRDEIIHNLPKGYEECMQYGMISYVVPHSIYPDGYHCDPKTPLPFMSLASQKNHIAVYHSGVYANETLSTWFTQEYKKIISTKLDMGKSCIRFKNVKKIPFELIGQLASKLTVQAWIDMYESAIKR